MNNIKMIVIFFVFVFCNMAQGLDDCGRHPQEDHDLEWSKIISVDLSAKIPLRKAKIRVNGLFCAGFSRGEGHKLVYITYRDTNYVFKKFHFKDLSEGKTVLRNLKSESDFTKDVRKFIKRANLIKVRVRKYDYSENDQWTKYKFYIRFSRKFLKSIFNDYRKMTFYFTKYHYENRGQTSYYKNHGCVFDKVKFNLSKTMKINKILLIKGDDIVKTVNATKLSKIK